MILRVLALLFLSASAAFAADRPNILWITSEDNGPHLGCYGDPDAVTPNLDRLAARGAIYRNCWSNCPVCAPARTAIITGMYPSSLGAEHMRSLVRAPAELVLWPQLLREAGYYCTNNAKEDYNVEKPGKPWDESSKKAHWKNRKAGQPFFAVFNIELTHESQVRKRPHTFVHDPEKVRIPGYHPDCRETREAWAQYHDQMTEMDKRAGELLAEVKEEGLEEETIVLYFGDHGPGLPRCKRTPCNSGLNVPLIVSIPERFQALAPPEYSVGAKLDRMVEFVDLGPSMLNLLGLSRPEIMQGQPFLGADLPPERRLLHGLRGRMDERYDCVRSVRNKRYVYIRNFMPHLPAGQHNAYMFATPMTVAWKKLFDEGKLPPEQARFFEPRQPEELYDLQKDPDEVNNLAGDPDLTATLERLRGECRVWMSGIRDVGVIPEAELIWEAGATPFYDFGRTQKLSLDHALNAADRATRESNAKYTVLQMKTGDSVVRFWAASGLLRHSMMPAPEVLEELRNLLGDGSPNVRIAAAEMLVRFGSEDDKSHSLAELLAAADVRKESYFAVVAALNAISNLKEQAAPVHAGLRLLPRKAESVPQRTGDYLERLFREILQETPLPG
jgi:arylsulfatase A-like enzyme